MEEEVKKEFAKLRVETQNQYEDALRTIEDDVASFKAKVTSDLAEMATRMKDVFEGYDERIKGHVKFTAEVVEKVEKNFVRGNEIILDKISDLEKKLVARLDGLGK